MSEEATLPPVDVAQPDAPALTELPPTTRAVIALKSSDTERELQALATKHAGLVEIKDKVDRAQVHGAAMELMRARTTISKTSKEARDDAVKFGKAVVAEEARLVAMIEPEEIRLKGLRDAWDTEQERIKREAEEKERQRLLALGARIQEIRNLGRLAQDCRSSDAVRRLADRLAGLDMTGFEEFEEEAVRVYTETRQQVEQTLNARLATEAEAARIKAEREELARQQAEAKRQADELAAQQKAEADKLAAERAEFARLQQEAAIKLVEQQAELERMRAEFEAAKAPKQEIEDAAEHAEVIVLTEQNISIQPTEQEESEVRIGFDMAMSMPITTTTPAFIGIDRGTDAPPAASLIHCIAFEYGVEHQAAQAWLIERAAEIAAYTAPQPAAA